MNSPTLPAPDSLFLCRKCFFHIKPDMALPRSPVASGRCEKCHIKNARLFYVVSVSNPMSSSM